MKLVTQPEMAYLKENGRVYSPEPPPDGYLFTPSWVEVDDGWTQEEIYQYLYDRLIKLEAHD